MAGMYGAPGYFDQQQQLMSTSAAHHIHPSAFSSIIASTLNYHQQ
jgi:hypothetical protein